jgi:hypothetical protein
MRPSRRAGRRWSPRPADGPPRRSMGAARHCWGGPAAMPGRRGRGGLGRVPQRAGAQARPGTGLLASSGGRAQLHPSSGPGRFLGPRWTCAEFGQALHPAEVAFMMQELWGSDPKRPCCLRKHATAQASRPFLSTHAPAVGSTVAVRVQAAMQSSSPRRGQCRPPAGKIA